MKLPERKTIVVLGAGPAGLSIGYELSRRDIDYIILEKGGVAGESFSHYPKHIFFGPWRNNTLPGSRVGWAWKLRRATQPAYTWYLGEYARHNQLPIQFQCTVLEVDREDQGFRVLTDQGAISCQLVINCTGYFSTPNIPKHEGQATTSVARMHSADYRQASDLQHYLGREGGRVLVVGAGLTAGESVADLHRHGYNVALSHRGRLVFGPSPWMEALQSPVQWVLERAAIALDIRLNSNPPMAGGESRHLIESGQVPVYPAISHFESDAVVFVDGQRRSLDAVLFATGYRYTVAHLAALLPEGPLELRHMESLPVPGLFFLGLDQQRTYRSRFLRGIRADARALGRLLEQRLARLPVLPPAPEFEVDLERLPQLVTVGAGN